MANDIFPLSFHAGVGGYYPADLVRAINQRGLKAFVKVVDDEGRAEEALRIGDEFGIENVSVYRVTKGGKGQGLEVEAPDELMGKPIPEAAAEWWDRHMNLISPDLDRRVWIELGNETNRNSYEWQGALFAEIAEKHALPAGWRVCAPGSNSGEPDSWKGWERYFQLAAKEPEKVSVSIHYYAWGVGQTPDETWDDYYPHHIGRESMIYDLCDQLNIDYPIIHISEGGFAHDHLPAWDGHAADFMDRLAVHVAAQPNMTGVAIWCAQPYQKNIHHQFNNEYVPKLVEMVSSWQPPATVPREDRPKPKIEIEAAGPASRSGPGTTQVPSRSAASGPLDGITANRFTLGHGDHHNSFKVNQQLWFEFEFKNTTGHDIPYGGLGVMAWRWQDGQWVRFRWQNSFGGFDDKLMAGQTLTWGDNIKLSEQGPFALALAITDDKKAREKVERPDDINGLQYLLQPIYVDISPHFADGKVLEKPPAPLFATKTVSPPKVDEGTPADEGDEDTTARPRGQHRATYILAPVDLTSKERARVYEMAWEGIEHAGGKSGGKHTLTFSHVDAFEAVRFGAPGSIVYIVAPERIGTGITPGWMAANAPGVAFELVDLP